MAKFIQVHCNGQARLFNLDWIEEIRDGKDDGSIIYFAFNLPNCIYQDSCGVDEKYDDLVHMIRRQTNG